MAVHQAEVASQTPPTLAAPGAGPNSRRKEYTNSLDKSMAPTAEPKAAMDWAGHAALVGRAQNQMSTNVAAPTARPEGLAVGAESPPPRGPGATPTNFGVDGRRRILPMMPLSK